VLDHQYRGGSRAFARQAPISSVLRIAPEGLVLGAGTVLLRADAPRRLQSPKDCEARLLTLLSAAYGRAVDPAVLGNIERAARAWNQGDDCLAYIHLAHARLGELKYPHHAAERLLIVDAFLKAGGSPRTVFEGLKLDAPYIDALDKEYNPAELRVPPGSGKPSGEWTRGGEAAKPPVPSFAPRVGTPAAASSLSELAPSAAVSLGRFALTVVTGAGGAAAVFGLLFIPSPNNIHVEGDVAGVPGLHYAFNRDEAVVQFTYNAPDGTRRTFTAWREGDVVRDVTGLVIGRVLPGDTIAFDLAAIAPDLVKQNEPKLCPEPPVPDKQGSDQGKSYEENRARQYEDYIKEFINSPPTPSGLVYELPKKDGDPITYDDCQRNSGIMIEIKGLGYAKLLQNPICRASIQEEFLKKADGQVEASGGQPIIWIFAEPEGAQFARDLFSDPKRPELNRIVVVEKRWER
jgi:hypothetical protein